MSRDCCEDPSAADPGGHGDATVAIAGNPNVGKSTVYNALTGENQHVANWVGKTVAGARGTVATRGIAFEVVDLPGTYSLAGMSPEEIEARRYLLEENPRAVVAVVDAANLERNLYLTMQLIEMGAPVIVALNMVDVAAKAGTPVDTAALSAALGVPVVPTVASRGEGMAGLVDTLAAYQGPASPRNVNFGEAVEAAVDEIAAAGSSWSPAAARWIALTLLEGDDELADRLAQSVAGRAVVAAAAAAAPDLHRALQGDLGLHIVQRRYEVINEIARLATGGPAPSDQRSDRIDRFVTHRILGIPLFLLSMGLVFALTTKLPEPTLAWIEEVITGPITRWLEVLLTEVGLGGSWFEALLVDGVLTGVGAVLAFIPVLVCLYVALAVLEDPGYMARAAFVVDRGMQVIGLPGKSFIPLLLGFGCNVPAIYATRTLESRRDRIVTGMLVPFMSCSARLPVYIVLAAAFFPDWTGIIVFSLYLLGILVAAVLGAVLTRVIHRGAPRAPLLMELPPYRMPSFRSVWGHTRRRTGMFLRDAGTVILVTAVVVWALLATPVRGGDFADVAPEDSAFGAVSSAVAPAFAPLGFDSWEMSGSAISGFVAKEVIVATLAQVHGVADTAAEDGGPAPGFLEDLEAIGRGLVATATDTLRAVPAAVGIDLGDDEAERTPTRLTASLQDTFAESSGGNGAAAGLAFMVFVLLYAPCVATAAAQRRELGTKWMALGMALQLGVAWLLALVTFQLGSLLGVG